MVPDKNLYMRYEILDEFTNIYYIVRNTEFIFGGKFSRGTFTDLLNLYKGFARKHVIANFFLAAETLFFSAIWHVFVVAYIIGLDDMLLGCMRGEKETKN